MEDVGNKNDNALTFSNKIMFFVDATLLILVSVLYGFGKDKDWAVDSNKILLIYIIFKSIFWCFRVLAWLLDEYATQVGGYWTSLYFVLWVPTMLVYFIIELAVFFDKDQKDCRKNASAKWGGLLVVAIEGLIWMLVFGIVLGALTVWAIILIRRSWKNKIDREVEVHQTELNIYPTPRTF